MKKVGFSTGCLYRFCSWEDALRIYQDHQVEYVEFGLLSCDKLMNCNPRDMKPYRTMFKTITIHAPCIQVAYGKSRLTGMLLKKLADISEILQPQTVVFHPDTIEDFSVFDSCPFPVSLENMDSESNRGIGPEDFDRFKTELDFTLVLDLQHVSEHDSSMVLGQELLDCMKEKVSHFHISGENRTSCHAILQSADNREAVLGFYRAHQEFLAIEEGLLGLNFDAEIEREKALLNR